MLININNYEIYFMDYLDGNLNPDQESELMAFLSLHPDKKQELEERRKSLLELIKSGRLPISPGNIQLIPANEEKGNKKIIAENSNDADLTIVGFRKELLKSKGAELFTGYENLGNILFVSSQKEKEIK